MRISKAARASIEEDIREANRQRIQYLATVVDGIRREVTSALGPDPHPDDAERLMSAAIDAAINAVLDLSDSEISQAVHAAEEEAYLRRLAKEDESKEPEKPDDFFIQRLRLQRGYR